MAVMTRANLFLQKNMFPLQVRRLPCLITVFIVLMPMINSVSAHAETCWQDCRGSGRWRRRHELY